MKHWKDISDSEFDELFKKASQTIKPEMKEGLWTEFKPKLDKAIIQPKSKFFRKRYLLALLAIFMFPAMVGINMYLNDEESKTFISSINQKPGIDNSEPTISQQKLNLQRESLNEIKDKTINKLSNEKSVNSTIRPESLAGNQKNVSTTLFAKKNSRNAIDDSKSLNLAFNDKHSSLSSTEDSFPIKSKYLNDSNLEKSLEKTNQIELETKTIDLNFPDSLNGRPPLPLVSEIAFSHLPIINDQAKYNPKGKKFENKIYLALSMSPDFSKVLNNSFLKMGYNTAAQIEYHLDKRWSIHSGVILSEKFYSSSPSGITWPERWGTIPKEMQGMEGTCKVIDIPLNIRYNLKYNERSKMYVLGGVSSFVLLNESYKYFYPEGFTFDGIKTKWARKDKEFLAAGMANFAIGYERKIGKIFSLQIEPFVKIPTRNFGFTEIKLASTGVFITGKGRLK